MSRFYRDNRTGRWWPYQLLTTMGLTFVAFVASTGSAAAQDCSNLLPQGGGQDDGVVISDCLKNSYLVHLAPSTTTPVVFLLKTPIKVNGVDNNTTHVARHLVGKPGMVTLRADFGCPIVGSSNPWITIGNGGQPSWTPAIRVDNVGIMSATNDTATGAGIVIRDVKIDVTNLGYDCDYKATSTSSRQKILGQNMIFLQMAPFSRIESVTVVGTKFDQPPIDSRGPGGANCGGIQVSRSGNSIVRKCTVLDVGFYQEHNDTSTSTEAILIRNSGNVLVDDNVTTRTAFGITIWNTPMSDSANPLHSCSGSIVSNNLMTGTGSATTGGCTGPPSTCGQGRGIKIINCDNDSVADDGLIMQNLTVTGNTIQNFGNNGTGEFPGGSTGSGISVDCGCQRSTFTNNSVIVTPDSQSAILFRSTSTGIAGTTPIYPSLMNTFLNNTFSTTSGGGPAFDVKFFANGFDQIGLGRVYNAAAPNQNIYGAVDSATTVGTACNDGPSVAQFETAQGALTNAGVVSQGSNIKLRATNIWGGHAVTFKFFACSSFADCPRTPMGTPTATRTFTPGTASNLCLDYMENYSTSALAPGTYQVFASWSDSATLITVNDVPIGQLRVAPSGQSIASDTAGVYIPASNTWFLKNSHTGGGADLSFVYGAGPTLVPIVGDWDGNGTRTPGVYDPASSSFFLRNSNNAGPADVVVSFGLGGAGYKPVVGDWDGDRTDTIGLYLPSTGTFFVKYKNTPGDADTAFAYGPLNAEPLVGDWNGDGRDSIGVYIPSSGAWFLRNSITAGVADIVLTFGPTGAQPIVGDWDGDNRMTVGVYIPTTGAFFLKNLNTSGTADHTFFFGVPGWTPIVGNWDGN